MLKFETLDDAVRDAERLLAAGYEKTGKWSLAQCCFHLSEWLRYPMDGFPRGPLPIRFVIWIVRNLMGKGMYQKVVQSGAMPAGKPTMPQSVAEPTVEDAAGVAKLKEVVERWKANTAPILPSPLFGEMTMEEAERLQRVHMAHHLSFLIPRDS